jgi:hypothetical protein
MESPSICVHRLLNVGFRSRRVGPYLPCTDRYIETDSNQRLWLPLLGIFMSEWQLLWPKPAAVNDVRQEGC